MTDQTLAPIDRFMAAYEPALYEALQKHPEDYAYGPADVPGFLPVWRKRILEGNFNHHGHAMKGACKRLGIKHTLKAIKAFLAGG